MRLLLILPGAVGDFIITLPSIVWLKRKLKPAWLEIWTERVNLHVAEARAYADRAVALADTGFNRWPTPTQVIESLRDFNLIISWRGAAQPEWVAEMRRLHANMHFLAGITRNGSLHAMDFRRSQLESLLGTDGHFPLYPEIVLSQRDLEFARQFLAREIASGLPMVMIHPGAGGAHKRWPAENFAVVISQLAQQHRHILLCEGPLDQEAVDSVLASKLLAHARTGFRRVRIENLMDLSAVISHSSVFVGNDCGISHLAAATGVATLSIFTTTDPRLWAPRGPKVKVLVQPAVDEVLENSLACSNSYERILTIEGS